MEQLKPVLEIAGEAVSMPQVFTDNPEF